MKSSFQKPKILVILGATSTGKSDVAVRLALACGGEIISADSRQVYSGLNIGTGKITHAEMRGIPHHMLDVVSPKKVWSVDEWRKGAQKCIADILSRGNVPIVCGGTGFYIQSIVDNLALPEVPPNLALRKKLEKKTAGELFKLLQKRDPKRAKTIERGNPARLIRALEIVDALGAVPFLDRNTSRRENPYDILQIGLALPPDELRERTHTRLLTRVKKGMIAEAKKLHESGLSWKRMHTLGLEYRYLAEFLQGIITKPELIAVLDRQIFQYTKRQITWFKRDSAIHWFHPRDFAKIEKTTKKFLNTKK